MRTQHGHRLHHIQCVYINTQASHKCFNSTAFGSTETWFICGSTQLLVHFFKSGPNLEKIGQPCKNLAIGFKCSSDSNLISERRVHKSAAIYNLRSLKSYHSINQPYQPQIALLNKQEGPPIPMGNTSTSRQSSNVLFCRELTLMLYVLGATIEKRLTSHGLVEYNRMANEEATATINVVL